MILRSLALGPSLSSAGCASLVPRPITGEPSSLRPPEQSWARVLKTCVDGQGRVDFAGLSRNRADLDRCVAWIYDFSPDQRPEQYPTPAHAFAFHLNAYSALAMYNVLESGIPKSLSGLARVKFLYMSEVMVGGRALTLYAYENDVIRRLGDPRVHFALNCMARSCPRLPREPFDAAHLEKQLDREASRFFNEKRNVKVDDERRTLRLSEILSFHKEDFLMAAPTLTAFVNRYRKSPVPEGYSIEFIAYDWTINRQP